MIYEKNIYVYIMQSKKEIYVENEKINRRDKKKNDYLKQTKMKKYIRNIEIKKEKTCHQEEPIYIYIYIHNK